MRDFKPLFFYGVVGGIGTTVHYVVLVTLVEGFSSGAVFASGVGFVFGAIVNHELNRRVTFRNTGNSYRTTSSRFMLIALVGLCMNVILIACLTVLAGLHYLPSQLLSTGAVFLATYWLNKRWTFSL